MTRSAFFASGIGKGLLTFALGTLMVLCGVDVHSMPALGAPVGRSTRSPSVRSTGPGSAKRQKTGKNRG
jgi:hypothetical protein